MKAVAGKIHRERRGVLKAISASQVKEAVLTREYQTVFKNNGKPMVIVDDDTTISLANVEFERLSGYTKKEIEGTKKLTEFVARQDRRRMKEYHLLRKSDPMLAPRCCEFRFVDRHGKIKNIVLTIGQIPGTTKGMASLQDVTDRRQAEVTQRASEERYQTFFENSRDAVYITTRDGTYVDANRAALDLFGYTREEMKKMKARQLYADPADARRLREEIEEKGFAQDFEVRLRKKDGTEMDCMFTVAALRGDDGSILEYQGIARDVTAHKRAEQALRESEEKYRDIFDSMLEGYFEVDLNGNLTFFNEAVSKFFGHSSDELMGLNYQAFTSPEGAQRLFQIFSEVFKTGNPHEIDNYEIVKKDGSIGIAEFSVSLLLNAAGEPIGFRGVTRDVTEKRKMERALSQSEKSYQKILELTPDGITISRIKDGCYLLVNDAFCQHTGYSAEEAIGRNALALNLFVDGADRERLARAVRQDGQAEGLEIQFRAKDGTILEDLVSARPIRFQGEDCLLVVATNVNALKKAQQALRQSEERYRDILENIEDSYYETDLPGNYTFFNEATCKHHGRTRDELLGMNYREHMSAETAKRIKSIFTEVYRTGMTATGVENEVIRKDGTIKLVELSVSLLRNASGEPIGFRGISRDRTDQKKIEEALRKSEEKYRTILENTTEGYFENDLHGNLTFFNASLPEVYGYTRDELLHMNYRQYMDEDTAQKVSQAYSKIYTTGKPDREIQYEIIRKDGTRRYLENSVSLILDADGKPAGFRGVARDITKRKKIEEDLQASEKKYRTMLDNIGDAYTETDLSGRVIFFNKAVSESLGYAEEEFVGMHYKKYTAPESVQKIYEIYNTVYRTGEPVKSVELAYIGKDGTKKILESTVALMHDKSGKPIGFKTFTNNITARKQAEEALRRSEERYRTIIENIQDGYFENDLAGNFTFVNDSLCKNLGYTRDELIGMNYQQYAEKENQKKVLQAYNKLYTTGEPVKGLEYEVITKDGAKSFTEISVSLIRDSKNKPIGFRGISRNVTERKKIEEELRKSEEKYRTILETMQEGYFEVDLAGNFTFVNDASCRHLGYTKEEMIGTNSKHFQDETTAEKMFQLCLDIYRTGEPIAATEAVWIKRDGTKGTYEASMSLIRDSKGNPIGFRGVSRNITERKKTEEALRRSEEKYRTILETMQEAYYELDLAGHFTFVNEAICRHLGYSKEELMGTDPQQLQDETTAKKIDQVYREIYRTGESVKALETEYIRKDGTKGMYELSASLIRDAQGKPIGFRGISRDITERKQAEEALRKSEEKYRTVLETMHEGYFEIDLAGTFTFINDAMCRIAESTRERLIGMSNLQYTDETTAKKLYEVFSSIYRTGEPVNGFAFEFTRRDGIRAFTELSVSLIRDAQGKPIGFRGISRDITERKQAEERLRQSEERYRTILESIEDGYYEVDLSGNFTFFNDVTCAHLGYPREQLIGMNNRQYTDEKTAKKLYHLYVEVYNTGKPLNGFVYERIRKDGTKWFSEVSVSLIRDAQDKPIGFRGISRDVTERKMAEEKLKRYAAELERSNEEVKNFAYIVSHDLRVPLVNLKGYTSELRTALGVIGANFDAALPHLIDEKRSAVAMALHEDVPEALEFITNSVSRMDSFINAILILSRLGRQDLKPEPLDMNAMVQAALESMSHQIKERGIEVHVGSLPQIVADRTAMERTIGNILSNAVKYVDPERPGRIEVAAEVKNGETIFTIQDSGRGIAQEDMHKVFAPFRRAGKQDTQGEGMGLAYVQTLVRRHGGRIWCESEPGKGTTFTFTIATNFKQGASDA